MKHIKILYLSICAIALLGACSKNRVPISEHPFDISVPRIEARTALIDVIPDNNDFFYIFGCIDTLSFSQIGGSEKFVEAADTVLKTIYKILYETESLEKFNSFLYKGAYDLVCNNLTPDTYYWAYAYPYNDTLPDVSKLTKLLFKTPKAKVSEITFSAVLNGSVITVTPSNNDQYFWDYISEKELNENYFGHPDFFYQKILDYYWEYGFLEPLLSKGEPSSSDMSEFYKLEAGDKFCLVCSGYDNGVSSEPEVFNVTYLGPDIPGIVEKQIMEEGDTPLSTALKCCYKQDYSASKVSLKRLNK